MERFDIKMSYFATKNVLFRHRFPVLFLLPRFIIIEKVKMSRIEFEVVEKEVIVKMISTSFQL